MAKLNFWQFNSRLQPGDIVLSTVPHAAVSKVIRGATGSPFSHAIIVTTPPLAVEAIGPGVVRVNLRGLLLRNRESIRVLRIASSEGQSVAREAARFAEGKILAPYAVKDAIRSVLPYVPPKQEGAYFCSNLVAEAFKKAGLDLTGKPPKKTTPGDILESSALVDVTDSCLDEANVLALATAYGILDDDRPKAPHHDEVETKRRIVQKLEPVLDRINLTTGDYDDLLKALIEASEAGQKWAGELDSAIASEVIESELFEILQTRVDSSEAFAFELRFLREIVTWGDQLSKDALESWVDELNGLIETRKETVSQLLIQMQGSRALYLKHGLETLYYEALLNDLALTRALHGLNAFERCKAFLEKGIESNF